MDFDSRGHDLLQHERRAEEALERCPICKECGYHIQEQEDAVYIKGKWFCDDCLLEMRKSIGD